MLWRPAMDSGGSTCKWFVAWRVVASTKYAGQKMTWPMYSFGWMDTTPLDYCMFCEGTRWLTPLTNVGIMIVKVAKRMGVHPYPSRVLRTHVAAMYPSPIFGTQVTLTLCGKVPQTTNTPPPPNREWSTPSPPSNPSTGQQVNQWAVHKGNTNNQPLIPPGT